MSVVKFPVLKEPPHQIGYTFYDTEGNNVGGAASTMHYRGKAQHKANQLNTAIYVYMSAGFNTVFIEKFLPNGEK